MTQHPDPKSKAPASSLSTHQGRPSEISPGVYEAKHFQTILGGPTLLFLKFIHETAFGDTRWRGGRWITKADLAGELSVSPRSVRDWVAGLEAAGYIRVRRGQGGFRVSLAKRIWYRNGRPIVATSDPYAIPYPPVQDSVPPRTEKRMGRPSKPASGAASAIPPSVDSPSVDSPSRKNNLNQEETTTELIPAQEVNRVSDE